MNSPAQRRRRPRLRTGTAVRTTFNTRVTNGPLGRNRHAQASTPARHSARRHAMTLRGVRAAFPFARAPRGPAGRGPGIDWLVVAGTAIAGAAFMFCVIASADGWHRAVTKPGILVSIAALIACVATARLRGDGE